MTERKGTARARFLDGLIWGGGFSAALLAGALLFLAIVFWLLPAIDSAGRKGPPDWSKFVVLNSTHRFVTDTEYNDGLHISGELQFEELPTFGRFWISAFVRDEEGALVDMCSEKYLTADVLGKVQPFVLRCKAVTTVDQFSSYQIAVRRWY